ncbi:hypothetical protein TNCV_328411 [Trichonephila clavipes]|nr:hypothetical protein TNCV_328411 [Trichonephila clavipes]
MSTNLAWELNTGVSGHTDHLTRTSGHAPQCPRPQKLRWAQQALALVGCWTTEKHVAIGDGTPYFGPLSSETWDTPLSKTSTSHQRAMPLITILGRLCKVSFGPHVGSDEGLRTWCQSGFGAR